MSCKPRQISGNKPLDAIPNDYNRYCGRIFGDAWAIVSGAVFYLQNVLSLFTKGAPDSTFSRGGSPITVPVWDATRGAVQVTTDPDEIASPFMRRVEAVGDGAGLGAELIENGTFTGGDTTGWTPQYLDPDGWKVVNDVFVHSGATQNYLTSTAAGFVGDKVYQLTVKIDGSVKLETADQGTLDLSIGTNVIQFRAISVFRFYSNAGGSVDNVSLKEVIPTFQNNTIESPFLNLAVIGDSISSDPSIGYQTQLESRYDYFDETVAAGIPANTLQQMDTRFAADVVANNPDVVMILGGINNIGPAVTSPVAAMQVAFESMVGKAVAASIDVVVLGLLPFGSSTTVWTWTQQRQTWLEEYNAYLLAYAQSNGLVFVDLYVALVGDDGVTMREGLTVDHVHPILDGYVIMADTIAEEVAESYAGYRTEILLHPINAAGVFLLYPAWADAEVVAAGSYRVDFVGVQAKYYLTVAGGTTSGTGVDDDTGVVWVLQGNYSNGGGGTLPGLLSEPTAATNSNPASRDFSGFTQTGTPTGLVAADAVGIDGVTNTAWTVGDDDPADFERFSIDTTIADDGATHAVSLHFEKDADETRFPELELTLSGGTGIGVALDLNTKNGATAFRVNTAGGTVRVESVGVYWRVCLTVTNNAAGNTTMSTRIYPAVGTVLGFANVAAVGTCVIDQLDINLNTDECTSPIITTIGPVIRNASSETNPHIFTARFLRYRVTDTLTETHLTDATNTFAYDSDTTTLTFTDGTTTLSTVTALAIGDTVVLDHTEGKLYVTGVLKATNALLDPIWTAITGIGNITDLIETAYLDPTNTTWDK